MVTVAGSPVALTVTEFKLLGVLIRNRTRVVPKAQLLAQYGATRPTAIAAGLTHAGRE